MGTSNSTYVGIYLEIPFLKGTVTEKFYASPTSGKRQKNKFDAQTGVRNLDKTETSVVYIEPTPWIEDVEGLCVDEFFRPAYTGGGKRIETFILSGADNKFKVCCVDSWDRNLFNTDLSSLNIPQLIEEFKVEYKAYLDYYIQEYETVNIKFGVVAYAH
jgi:hypothetical protein